MYMGLFVGKTNRRDKGPNPYMKHSGKQVLRPGNKFFILPVLPLSSHNFVQTPETSRMQRSGPSVGTNKDKMGSTIHFRSGTLTSGVSEVVRGRPPLPIDDGDDVRCLSSYSGPSPLSVRVLGYEPPIRKMSFSCRRSSPFGLRFSLPMCLYRGLMEET